MKKEVVWSGEIQPKCVLLHKNTAHNERSFNINAYLCGVIFILNQKSIWKLK